MIEKILDVSDGPSLQRVVGDLQQQEQLIAFLTEILEEHIEAPIQDITSIKVARDSLDIPEEEEQSNVEIDCRDQSGQDYIVRIQIIPEKDAELRIHYHASQAYVNQAPDDLPPDKVLTPVIFVALTDFVMFPAYDNYKSAYNWMETETKTIASFLNNIRYTILELPKLRKHLAKQKEQADR